MTDYKAIAENVIGMVLKAANESGKASTCIPVTIDGKAIIVNREWDNPAADNLGVLELTQVGREIQSICLAKGYCCTIYNYQLSARYWDCTCRFPESITIFTKDVCPEFIELQKICREKLNIFLTRDNLYRAHTSGKRGRYFEDVASRRYTCDNPKECQYLIDRIGKCLEKGIKMHIGKHEDQEDRQASIYYETECYGSIEYDICPVTMG